MNTGQFLLDTPPGLNLKESEKTEVLRLAATGLNARDIANSMEWSEDMRREFVCRAVIPGSDVAGLLAEGRALGVSIPMRKAMAAAEAGNLDAIKQIRKIQRQNRVDELLSNMDDDEFNA